MSQGDDAFVQLIKAESILQREAIVTALDSEGIEFFIIPRDTSRKVFDSSIDLTMGGISTVFDGFPILVRPLDLERAQRIVRQVIGSADQIAFESKNNDSIDYWDRFYRASIFTIFLPGLMHLAALMNLFMAVKTRQPLTAIGKVITGTLLCLVWLAAAIYLKIWEHF